MKFSQLWMLAKRNTRVIPGVNRIIAFSQLQAPDRVPFQGEQDPAIEENGLGFVVSDEKEKRAVSIKCLPDGEDFLHADNPTGCDRLGTIFSSTSTKVLWTTFDRYKLGLGEIPVRSAFVSSKISVMPMSCRIGLRS